MEGGCCAVGADVPLSSQPIGLHVCRPRVGIKVARTMPSRMSSVMPTLSGQRAVGAAAVVAVAAAAASDAAGASSAMLPAGARLPPALALEELDGSLN